MMLSLTPALELLSFACVTWPRKVEMVIDKLSEMVLPLSSIRWNMDIWFYHASSMLCCQSKLRDPSIYSALQTSFCDIFTKKHSSIISLFHFCWWWTGTNSQSSTSKALTVYLFEKGHKIQVQESVGSWDPGSLLSLLSFEIRSLGGHRLKTQVRSSFEIIP